MAHPNEELLRRGYEAFAKGDLGTVMSIFDEDIVWHEPGRSPLSGDFKGHQQVQELFGRIFEMSGGTFSIEIHDILANDGHAVVMLRSRATRPGKSLDSVECHVWHLSNGKATEFWGVPFDLYAADEFWS
jgi:ketosteroid isomerase-like protein